MNSKSLSQIVLFFFIFSSLIILVSLNIGLFVLHSPSIFIVAFLLSLLLYKKWTFHVTIPLHVWLLALLMGLLLAYPVLLSTPFYTGGSDPAQTIILRVLTDRIPQTFAPYADLSFTYQFSYHLLVKVFNDILPFLPDYLWLWLLGVVFGAFQIVSVYLSVLILSDNKRAALYSSILLFGTKAIYRDVLVGGFHTVLAVNFLLLALVCFHKKNKLAYLFFPAAVAVHPHIGALSFLLFGAYLFFFRGGMKRFLKLLPSLVLIIPVFMTTYLALFIGLVDPGDPLTFHLEMNPLFYALIPLFIGIVPSAFFGVSVIDRIIKRKLTKEQKFYLSLSFLVILLYVILGFVGFRFLGKLFELGIIAVVSFSGLVLSTWRSRKFLFIGILLLGIVVILSSGELNNNRFVGKVSPEEAQFAFAFKEYDPDLKTVFIFSKGSQKISEYANKIPYDPYKDWYLPYDDKQVFHDEGLELLKQNHNISEDILSEACISCVQNLGVDYLVINHNQFDLPFEDAVFTYKNFTVHTFE